MSYDSLSPLVGASRENQVATAPRLDRPCFLTSWCHSTTLGVLLCGWNDGAVDVINPRMTSLSFRLQRSQQQLLPPGGACVPTTAVGLIPLSLLLRHTGNQFFSDEPRQAFSSHDGTAAGAGVVALVGGANGTLGLWPTNYSSCRPWNVILAHTDAIVAIRTAMDAPQHALERLIGVKATATAGGIRDSDGESSFFVVTAGANREVKVWGIETADRQDIPPLTLAGYTVVGGGGGSGGGRLTALELLSEGHMVCGFDSGAIEVWSIPFASRGGVLASTREAVQSFPLAHGATVTSIAVSIGMGFRAQAGGGVKAGRVILTTSTDRTVVRWVFMTPGDSIRPLRRYCLSEEPAAAVLLPPVVVAVPTAFTAGRHVGGPVPPSNFANIDVEVADSAAAAAETTSRSKTSTMFRVVVALNGVVAVLELATVETLIGEGACKQSTKLCPAVANAFPGTPFVPQLPPRRVACESLSEQSRAQEAGPCSWRVGGPQGREAGRYDVLGGIGGPLLGWEASGKRRMVLTAASRKAWNTCRAGEGGDGMVPSGTGLEISRPRDRGRDGDKHDATGPSACPTTELRPESSQGEGRKRPRGDAVKRLRRDPLRRRSATVKPSVKTLTILTAQDSGRKNTNSAHDHDRSVGMAPEDAYRKVSGGRTIKMDPGFAAAAVAAAWERLLLQQPPSDEDTANNLPPPAVCGGESDGGNVTEQHRTGMYSMELAVPDLDGRPSAFPRRDGEDELSAIAISFQGTNGSLNDGDGYPPRFPYSDLSLTAVTGGPPFHTNADSVVLGSDLSASSQRSEQHQHPTKTVAVPGNDSLIHEAASVPMGKPTTGRGHPGNSNGAGAAAPLSEGNNSIVEDDRAMLAEQQAAAAAAAESVYSDESSQTVSRDVHDNDKNTRNEGKKETGPMNTVVAAAAAARRARESWDARGLESTPLVIERRPSSSMQEPRLQFNFDFAQAPSPGMSGVGVAVPRGYADERFVHGSLPSQRAEGRAGAMVAYSPVFCSVPKMSE